MPADEVWSVALAFGKLVAWSLRSAARRYGDFDVERNKESIESSGPGGHRHGLKSTGVEAAGKEYRLVPRVKPAGSAPWRRQ